MADRGDGCDAVGVEVALEEARGGGVEVPRCEGAGTDVLYVLECEDDASAPCGARLEVGDAVAVPSGRAARALRGVRRAFRVRHRAASRPYEVRRAADRSMERFEAEMIRVDGNRYRDGHVSVAEVDVDAGVRTALHSLAARERYLIVHGTASVEVGGAASRRVAPGDVVDIPRGAAQRLLAHTPLRMLCVCVPPFEYGMYTHLEDARAPPS